MAGSQSVINALSLTLLFAIEPRFTFGIGAMTTGFDLQIGPKALSLRWGDTAICEQKALQLIRNFKMCFVLNSSPVRSLDVLQDNFRPDLMDHGLRQ